MNVAVFWKTAIALVDQPKPSSASIVTQHGLTNIQGPAHCVCWHVGADNRQRVNAAGDCRAGQRMGREEGPPSSSMTNWQQQALVPAA